MAALVLRLPAKSGDKAYMGKRPKQRSGQSQKHNKRKVGCQRQAAFPTEKRCQNAVCGWEELACSDSSLILTRHQKTRLD